MEKPLKKNMLVKHVWHRNGGCAHCYVKVASDVSGFFSMNEAVVSGFFWGVRSLILRHPPKSMYEDSDRH